MGKATSSQATGIRDYSDQQTYEVFGADESDEEENTGVSRYVGVGTGGHPVGAKHGVPATAKQCIPFFGVFHFLEVVLREDEGSRLAGKTDDAHAMIVHGFKHEFEEHVDYQSWNDYFNDVKFQIREPFLQ